MSKDITEKILLKAGFNKEECYSIVCPYRYIKILSDVYVDVSNVSCMPMRDWNVRIYDRDDYYGGIVAYEDNGRIMVKFFESDDDGYYVADELNLWLDAFWVKAYKDALERMYNWLESNCEKNEHGYTKLFNFKMKKVMISQPMNGLTDEEIEKVKVKATKELSKEHYEVVNTFFTGSEECDWADTQHNTPIAYLALSLKKMAEVDAVYFCKGWSEARECVIEHEVAKNYGLEILGYNS